MARLAPVGHSSITVRPGHSGDETTIEVRGWPGHVDHGWVVYTPEHVPARMRHDADWNRGDVTARARRLAKRIGRSSGSEKGRVVTAYGWHRFTSDVALAELLLHVEHNRPLMIVRFSSSTDMIEAERYAVRSLLIACAVDIAEELRDTAGIDHGWLDWRVHESLVRDVLATAPGFAPQTKVARRRRRRGADVVLRRR